jgi:predicted phosphodiesterase
MAESTKNKQLDFLNHPSFAITSKIKAHDVAVAKAEVANPQTGTVNRIAIFLEEKIFKWFSHSIKHWLTKKTAFRNYKGKTHEGIYTLRNSTGENNKAIIALTADWGTNTEEAANVANKMLGHAPDYTIHLGDTYYTGEADEIAENFTDTNAPWKKGSVGSFAMVGNHEMYSNGAAFFDVLMPTMGAFDPAPGVNSFVQQNASFFCLQSERWNIIALDTGYNSIGFPFLINPYKECELEAEQVEWLKNLLRKDDKNRGIVFLSHHQYYSAYEDEYLKPAKQLRDIIKDREVLWIFGHEHRLALYGKYKCEDGITAYGRCIGHGGMPVEILKTYDKEKKKKFAGLAASRNLVITDKRLRFAVDDIPIGFNGYAILQVADPNISITYFSTGYESTDAAAPLITETWTVDNQGIISGTAQLHVTTPDFKPVANKTIANICQ